MQTKKKIYMIIAKIHHSTWKCAPKIKEQQQTNAIWNTTNKIDFQWIGFKKLIKKENNKLSLKVL